jgi:hypothetical protein
VGREGSKKQALERKAAGPPPAVGFGVLPCPLSSGGMSCAFEIVVQGFGVPIPNNSHRSLFFLPGKVSAWRPGTCELQEEQC